MLRRLEVTRGPFEGGRVFGAGGAYELLVGSSYFAVDPAHPANAGIVDLQLAPRTADGCVEFSADVRILRPVGGGNRRLVLDVVNRGNPVALRNTDLEPSEGWLLQQGFTVVSCGWQHNVPPGTERLGLRAPEALDPNGQPLRGQVRSVHQVNVAATMLGVADEPSGAVHVAYPVADVDDPTATLKESDYPLGPKRVIPRAQWRFARHQDGQLIPDRTHVVYDHGFVPGKIYEIVYTAEGAAISGLGFAALRDVVSFLRFAPDEAGNPCAGTIDFALAFGGSQTGRLLRHMLYLGQCVDEAERLVLDGVLTLIAGPIRTEGNWRFGQPSFIGSDSPGFGFPFTDAVQTDTQTNITDGLLAKLARQGKVPKVMHVNTSAEYSNLSVALIHLTPDAHADAPLPDNVRIYHLAGAHHGGGRLPLDNRIFSSVAAYYNNTIDYRPLVRALFQNLDAWVAEDRPPPPSRYPKLSEGSLVTRDDVRQSTAGLPGPGMPDQRLYPTQRLNYGPESGLGRASFPPTDTGAYPDLLPAVDVDGNEVSGIRHPDVAVPLGTYTGWNPRHPSTGGAVLNLLLNGSTIPFARTPVEREATADPRLSIAERYPSRAEFLDQIRACAQQLAQERYLLASDVEPIVETSSRRYDEFMQLTGPLPA